jgi:hypothetical protein
MSVESITMLTTFDLCLTCRKTCKLAGPPWCKLECPFSSGIETKYNDYRILNMTDEELIARIAYA